MNTKKTWWIVGGIVVIIGGAIIFALTNKGQMPIYTQSETSTKQATEETPTQTAGAGSYVEYTKDRLAAADGQRWLFFHAGWCPQCRALEQDIKASGVPAGVTIFKVNYDTETALKKKYGVTLQTTIVAVDKNGAEQKKFVAYDDPSLKAVVKALGK